MIVFHGTAGKVAYISKGGVGSFVAEGQVDGSGVPRVLKTGGG